MSRVLVIGGWPPSLVKFRGHLLASMRARGHEVFTCAGGVDAATSLYLAEIGIPYIPLPINRVGVNPLKDILLLIRLVYLMWRIKPDVVLAYTIKPVIYGMLAARFTGIRRRHALITGLGYAFIANGSFKQNVVGLIVRRLYRPALHNCASVFFQNDDDLRLFRVQELIRARTSAIRVMGSGVDLQHFLPVPIPSGSITFLLVARLLSDKGIREYAMATQNLRRRYPEIRCALLGPRDFNPSAIKSEEITGWVRDGVLEYWGETDDVRPYLARCSVFVLPSYREGMPRTVLEAMAMGRPIITTDVPGCRETVVDGENGWLVPVRDVAALATAMEKCCLKNEAELAAMGWVSRQKAEASFGVGAVNQIVLERLGL